MDIKDKERSEQRFQELLNSDLNDKKVWEELWTLVDWCCSNLAKSMIKGIKMSPEKFEMRYQEAVFEIMTKIKNGTKPASMSAFFYWPVKRALISKKAMQEDRECLSYEAHTENILAQENIGETE